MASSARDSGRLIVYGASGHGKVVADAATAAGWEVLGFADDDPGARSRKLLGLEVLAIGAEELRRYIDKRPTGIAMGIGDNAARKRVFERLRALGFEMATIVHPSAVVAPSARFGSGTVVFGGVVVNADTVLDEDVIINTGATVDHDNAIGAHAHVSPGAHLGGIVCIGEGTHVGIGTTVRNNLTVGCWSLIGAGSVVVKDIPDRVVAFGCPARVVRRNQSGAQ